MPKDDIALNSVFIKNRLAELGLKQWWLAEQLGVDRKTVIRWVQGQVKSIQRENAIKLAGVLNCSLADLVLPSESDLFATTEDQKQAAQSLKTSRLVEKLGPIGEWDVIENLLKATIVPNLPLNVLGDLYNQLCVASWRQSKLDQAELFNRKGEEIARNTNDLALLGAALLSKANLFSWRGQTRKSILTYEECLTYAKYLPPKTVAGAFSNLGSVLFESGNADGGIRNLTSALEIYEHHGKPMNLSIAHCHLARIELETGRLNLAKRHCEISLLEAKKDEYQRGLQMGQLVMAEIFAWEGRMDEAKAICARALEGFSRLQIEEGLNFEHAARIHRLAGDLEKAVAYARHGIQLSKDFPIYRAALHWELGRILRAKGAESDSLAEAKLAYKLFFESEADFRAYAVAKDFPHVT